MKIRPPLKRLKIVLFTGYRCNNNCRFCINADKRDLPEKSTAELMRDLYDAKRKGAGIVEIIGGESTIRPDFPALVKTARQIGIEDVVAATNGRIFSDPAAARAIVRSGISGLIFSVHGPDARTHDALTQSPGSFRELVKGMETLRSMGFRNINGNTTVVKQNMRKLPAIARFYTSRGIKNVELIFVDPNYGGARNEFDSLVPRISAAAPLMRKALDIGTAAGFPEWKARYVPLCHFRGYMEQISEINERMLFTAEHWAPDFTNADAISSRQTVGRRKPARCRGCAAWNSCEGIWTEYLRRYGDKELKPMKRFP